MTIRKRRTIIEVARRGRKGEAGIGTVNIDTDTTLAANSDAVVPSQKAVKAYVDANAGGGSSGGSGDPLRTLSVVGDFHLGIYTSGSANDIAAKARQQETIDDLASLDGLHARRIYVGDLVDSPGTTDSMPSSGDLEFQALANSLDADWLAVPGNHDTNSQRDAAEWGMAYGRSANFVEDLGFCRVIGIAWDTGTPSSTISAATLTFLETELRKSSKNTIVLCHFPIYGTVPAHPVDKGYSTFGTYATGSDHAVPDPDIRVVLDKYPHARIWLNGHSHTPISAPGIFSHVWTGTRNIITINAGAIPYTDANVGASKNDPPRSLYLTVREDRVEVRIRNHREKVWEPYRHTAAWPERYTVPHEMIVPENPTSLLIGFNDAIQPTDRNGVAPHFFSGADTYEEKDGLKGLVMTSGLKLTIDPRPYLRPDQGSVAMRLRFQTPTESGSNYFLLHMVTGVSDQRINVMRSATSNILFQFGTASGAANNLSPVADMDIHTISISWIEGWYGLLYVDGVRQMYVTSSNDLESFITTISNEMRFGANHNIVLYDVLLSSRALAAEEHARLSKTPGQWSWSTLKP